MKILYVSTLCSDYVFKVIFENSSIKPQQQEQKFHSLLSKGLMRDVKDIYFLSRPPVDLSNNRKLNISVVKEKYERATYHYLKVVEKPVLKHIILFVSAFISTIKWGLKNQKEQKIIICDILKLSISLASLLASKILGIRSVAVITDLPNYMGYTKQNKTVIGSISLKLYRNVSNYFLQRYDYYVLLTEQMNNLVNPNNKPYIVVEGLVDNEIELVDNIIQDKYKEKVIIYAGALHERNGIKCLLEAFMRLQDSDARLWLFGTGDMVSEIKKYQNKDCRIKSFGVVANDQVVKEQLKATLLVNPRPSIDEFTKYSFPSKNMEYMVSGTPVLTTKLPGMPKDYFSYVYLIEDESAEGITRNLESLLNMPRTHLHKKGYEAKEFVIKNKNNVYLAKKIIDLIDLEQAHGKSIKG